jgi:hypothetical protein
MVCFALRAGSWENSDRARHDLGGQHCLSTFAFVGASALLASTLRFTLQDFSIEPRPLSRRTTSRKGT